MPRVTLNDGHAIPQFGLGVYHVPPEETANLVRTALELGYRHVDTAQGYGNEAGVGQGLRDAGVAREDVWITTKLDDGSHGYDAACRALDESLRRLGTEYVDLFLIHRPGEHDLETWRAFEALQAEGRVRSVGLSNFGRRGIERLAHRTGLVPAVNQIRVNPRTPHQGRQRYHRRRGITTESWGPLREGRLTSHPTARRVAARVGRTPAQVILRWHLQRGLVVFPKSADPARLAENLGATDFELSRRDMTAIDLMRRRP
ncbi:aldo/keto reductase [Actinomycetospora endophytica]|uniref:Aldo/keto reductase n=1 Tax=Actinomycetospora endophytica TaxID=2291215 RepID=A0ABS8P1I1_9PSEU|nr:aldo/keto reductase [Actinomycetospora endophytica]MCD2192117.1 aldo/keto reductase [Actinomycetospora endophytica]